MNPWWSCVIPTINLHWGFLFWPTILASEVNWFFFPTNNCGASWRSTGPLWVRSDVGKGGLQRDALIVLKEDIVPRDPLRYKAICWPPSDMASLGFRFAVSRPRAGAPSARRCNENGPSNSQLAENSKQDQTLDGGHWNKISRRPNGGWMLVSCIYVCAPLHWSETKKGLYFISQAMHSAIKEIIFGGNSLAYFSRRVDRSPAIHTNRCCFSGWYNSLYFFSGVAALVFAFVRVDFGSPEHRKQPPSTALHDKRNCTTTSESVEVSVSDIWYDWRSLSDSLDLGVSLAVPALVDFLNGNNDHPIVQNLQKMMCENILSW